MVLSVCGLEPPGSPQAKPWGLYFIIFFIFEFFLIFLEADCACRSEILLREVSVVGMWCLRVARWRGKNVFLIDQDKHLIT
jgi:hypothetical protein